MAKMKQSLTPSFHKEISALKEEFKEAVRFNVPMAKYSSARVGGKADVLIYTTNALELEKVITRLWAMDLPYIILGGCSNILVSDHGIREIVVLNRARGLNATQFNLETEPALIKADSAVNLGLLARKAAHLGLTGLEWATGIPGTLGGAIVGNAGAHSSEIANNLWVADILQRNQNRQPALPSIASWTNEQFEFGYRSSILKEKKGEAVVLSAVLQVNKADAISIQEKTQDFIAYRQRTQPPGASMGSIFKNPAGDYAGRLIEQAGLKGTQIGGAQISLVHGNFFINSSNASATDIIQLIQLAQKTVLEKSGIKLDLEIELIGDWQDKNNKGDTLT